MSFSAVFEARADDGTALHRFVGDTDLVLDLAEELAGHPGRPKGISFTWYRGDVLRNPKALAESLRWMEQFLRHEVALSTDSRPRRGAPPLHHAAAAGDLDKLRSAIERARKIDRIDAEMTALMWAVLNNHAEAVHILLAAGARVDAHAEAGELESTVPDPPRRIDLSRYASYTEGDITGAIELCERARSAKARVWVSGI